MKTRIAVLSVIFLLSQVAFSQPPETKYEGNLIATGFKQSIPLASAGPYEIGFSFTFFGNTYTQFYVNANGLVMFSAPDNLYNDEITIPDAANPNNYIAPFWDNLSIMDGGNVMYKTIGASPNQKCIIQFKNMGFDPVPTPFATFSVILYQTTNTVQVQYRLIVDPYSPNPHGASATIGLENADGTAGTLYKFHQADAVYSEDAILFTPSGPTSYTVNDNALYDGVFLTTNLTLPDPGIVDLVSPALDAVIGADHTFTWTAASNAAEYFFVIDTKSDLSTATYTNVGPNLSHSVTGLSLNETYYWTILASNATSFSWCEVSRFSTSAAPPLAAVPQTIWTEQGQDKTIPLSYTGGDAGPKTAIITSLPTQGQLFQYNAGSRGTEITSVPANVTDGSRNVIYAATGSAGNGVGNFNFKMNDATGDSPEATITVNVSPPGIPSVLYFAKSTNVEIQLDRPMSDPAGKQSQFEVKVDGSPVTINTVNLKTGDPNTIVLNLATPLTGTETVLVSYTQGDVTATTGGFLLSFADQSVTLTAQTITWTQTLDKKYNESPFAITATASSELGLTYFSSNLSVATFIGNIVTLKSLGTSDITVRQTGNTTYAPVKYTRTLSVSKGDQTITFDPIPEKAIGDPDFNLTATASSGLPVSFTSSNTDVATVTGTLVHIVGKGTTTITASQAGSELWNPAPDKTQPLTVIITGIEDPYAFENSFNIYSRDNYIIIRTLDESWDGKRGSVKLFDIAGRPVKILRNTEFSKNSEIEVPVMNAGGLYVVEFRSGAMRVTRKVVVR